jgi:diacylglycerol kinase (ATP)
MSAAASKEIPVILNPRARSKRAAGLVERIAAISPRVRIVATSEAGEARHLAAQLSREGYAKIVAAGGDGTVNEVVNGLVDAGLEIPKPGHPAVRDDECLRQGNEIAIAVAGELLEDNRAK